MSVIHCTNTVALVTRHIQQVLKYTRTQRFGEDKIFYFTAEVTAITADIRPQATLASDYICQLRTQNQTIFQSLSH